MKSFYDMFTMLDQDADWQGKKLTADDMSQASEEDLVQQTLEKKRLGINPTKLGEPMSDEELADFMS